MKKKGSNFIYLTKEILKVKNGGKIMKIIKFSLLGLILLFLYIQPAFAGFNSGFLGTPVELTPGVGSSNKISHLPIDSEEPISSTSAVEDFVGNLENNLGRDLIPMGQSAIGNAQQFRDPGQDLMLNTADDRIHQISLNQTLDTITDTIVQPQISETGDVILNPVETKTYQYVQGDWAMTGYENLGGGNESLVVSNASLPILPEGKSWTDEDGDGTYQYGDSNWQGRDLDGDITNGCEYFYNEKKGVYIRKVGTDTLVLIGDKATGAYHIERYQQAPEGYYPGVGDDGELTVEKGSVRLIGILNGTEFTGRADADALLTDQSNVNELLDDDNYKTGLSGLGLTANEYFIYDDSNEEWHKDGEEKYYSSSNGYLVREGNGDNAVYYKYNDNQNPTLAIKYKKDGNNNITNVSFASVTGIQRGQSISATFSSLTNESQSFIWNQLGLATTDTPDLTGSALYGNNEWLKISNQYFHLNGSTVDMYVTDNNGTLSIYNVNKDSTSGVLSITTTPDLRINTAGSTLTLPAEYNNIDINGDGNSNILDLVLKLGPSGIDFTHKRIHFNFQSTDYGYDFSADGSLEYSSTLGNNILTINDGTGTHTISNFNKGITEFDYDGSKLTVTGEGSTMLVYDLSSYGPVDYSNLSKLEVRVTLSEDEKQWIASKTGLNVNDVQVTVIGEGTNKYYEVKNGTDTYLFHGLVEGSRYLKYNGTKLEIYDGTDTTSPKTSIDNFGAIAAILTPSAGSIFEAMDITSLGKLFSDSFNWQDQSNSVLPDNFTLAFKKSNTEFYNFSFNKDTTGYALTGYAGATISGSDVSVKFYKKDSSTFNEELTFDKTQIEKIFGKDLSSLTNEDIFEDAKTFINNAKLINRADGRDIWVVYSNDKYFQFDKKQDGSWQVLTVDSSKNIEIRDANWALLYTVSGSELGLTGNTSELAGTLIFDEDTLHLMLIREEDTNVGRQIVDSYELQKAADNTALTLGHKFTIYGEATATSAADNSPYIEMDGKKISGLSLGKDLNGLVNFARGISLNTSNDVNYLILGNANGDGFDIYQLSGTGNELTTSSSNLVLSMSQTAWQNIKQYVAYDQTAQNGIPQPELIGWDNVSIVDGHIEVAVKSVDEGRYILKFNANGEPEGLDLSTITGTTETEKAESFQNILEQQSDKLALSASGTAYEKFLSQVGFINPEGVDWATFNSNWGAGKSIDDLLGGTSGDNSSPRILPQNAPYRQELLDWVKSLNLPEGSNFHSIDVTGIDGQARTLVLDENGSIVFEWVEPSQHTGYVGNFINFNWSTDGATAEVKGKLLGLLSGSTDQDIRYGIIGETDSDKSNMVGIDGSLDVSYKCNGKGFLGFDDYSTLNQKIELVGDERIVTVEKTWDSSTDKRWWTKQVDTSSLSKSGDNWIKKIKSIHKENDNGESEIREYKSWDNDGKPTQVHVIFKRKSDGEDWEWREEDYEKIVENGKPTKYAPSSTRTLKFSNGNGDTLQQVYSIDDKGVATKCVIDESKGGVTAHSEETVVGSGDLLGEDVPQITLNITGTRIDPKTGQAVDVSGENVVRKGTKFNEEWVAALKQQGLDVNSNDVYITDTYADGSIKIYKALIERKYYTEDSNKQYQPHAVYVAGEYVGSYSPKKQTQPGRGGGGGVAGGGGQQKKPGAGDNSTNSAAQLVGNFRNKMLGKDGKLRGGFKEITNNAPEEVWKRFPAGSKEKMLSLSANDARKMYLDKLGLKGKQIEHLMSIMGDKEAAIAYLMKVLGLTEEEATALYELLSGMTKDDAMKMYLEKLGYSDEEIQGFMEIFNQMKDDMEQYLRETLGIEDEDLIQELLGMSKEDAEAKLKEEGYTDDEIAGYFEKQDAAKQYLKDTFGIEDEAEIDNILGMDADVVEEHLKQNSIDVTDIEGIDTVDDFVALPDSEKLEKLITYLVDKKGMDYAAATDRAAGIISDLNSLESGSAVEEYLNEHWEELQEENWLDTFMDSISDLNTYQQKQKLMEIGLTEEEATNFFKLSADDARYDYLTNECGLDPWTVAIWLGKEKQEDGSFKTISYSNYLEDIFDAVEKAAEDLGYGEQKAKEIAKDAQASVKNQVQSTQLQYATGTSAAKQSTAATDTGSSKDSGFSDPEMNEISNKLLTALLTGEMLPENAYDVAKLIISEVAGAAPAENGDVPSPANNPAGSSSTTVETAGVSSVNKRIDTFANQYKQILKEVYGEEEGLKRYQEWYQEYIMNQ